MNKCKQCGNKNNNGTNFCTHKCRVKWRLEHEIKGAKRKSIEKEEKFLMSFGSGFSNEDETQNSY